MRIDFWLLAPAAFLTAMGTAVLFSVSPGSFPEQFIFIALAFFLFLILSKIEIKILREFAPHLFAFSLVLLLITILIGVTTKGASRWISIAGITIQPSEFAKPASILFFSYLVTQTTNLKRFFWVFLAALPIIFLVYKQPDLGSSLVLSAGLFGVVFLGGIPLPLLGALTALVVAAVPIIWNFLIQYQKDRILSFLSPMADPQGTGYNALQALISIGSGNMTGRGLGQGTQSQLAFLPERHTDFIFAAASEEMGFLGSAVIILALAILLARIIVLIKSETDLFTSCVLGGIFFIFFTQTVINIGMNIGVMPITGIPLPFVSSGGSHLVASGILLGIAASATASRRS